MTGRRKRGRPEGRNFWGWARRGVTRLTRFSASPPSDTPNSRLIRNKRSLRIQSQVVPAKPSAGRSPARNEAEVLEGQIDHPARRQPHTRTGEPGARAPQQGGSDAKLSTSLHPKQKTNPAEVLEGQIDHPARRQPHTRTGEPGARAPQQGGSDAKLSTSLHPKQKINPAEVLEGQIDHPARRQPHTRTGEPGARAPSRLDMTPSPTSHSTPHKKTRNPGSSENRRGAARAPCSRVWRRARPDLRASSSASR
jgi:hypothetical protein